MFQLLGVGALGFVVITGALWLAVARAQPTSLESAPVRGVGIGMTPEAVRVAFTDGPVGRWSAAPGCCGDSLEWTRVSADATPARWARFEFHEGLLVAIRLLSDPSTPVTRHVDMTRTAVSEVRAGADGSTSTTVLARACETHRAEVNRLIAAARSSP